MSQPHGNHRNTGTHQRSKTDYNERRDRSRSRSRSKSPTTSSSSSSTSCSRSPSPVRRDRRDRRDEHRSSESRTANAASSRRPEESRSSHHAPAARGFSIGSRSGGGGMAPPTSNKILPVQMKLASSKPTEVAKKITVASAFCNDSDDDDDGVEEMPAECRMRMRNIGRDTPTSSGPNSFGKTKQGFCDSQKIIEKNLKETSGLKK